MPQWRHDARQDEVCFFDALRVELTDLPSGIYLSARKHASPGLKQLHRKAGERDWIRSAFSSVG